VDVYTGSLSSVVENYSRADETSVVMRAQNNLFIIASSADPSLRGTGKSQSEMTGPCQ
jgi:hypothetical protein